MANPRIKLRRRWLLRFGLRATLLAVFLFSGETPIAWSGPMRYWQDSSGKQLYKAELLEVGQESIRLKTDRKGTFEVPLATLCRSDQQFVAAWQDPRRREILEKAQQVAHVAFDDQGIALHIGQSGATDHDLTFLVQLPDIYKIHIFECPITDEGLAQLAGLRGLRSLEITETKVEGPGLQHLAGLASLETFSYSPQRQLDLGTIAPHLVHLTGLKKLKRLELLFCDLTRASGVDALATIGEMAALESLKLFMSPVESSQFFHLAGLKQLAELDLQSSDIRGRDLVHLTALPKLRSLSLDSAVDDDGAVSIGKLTSLESLGLLNNSITDRQLRPLIALNRLKSLQLVSQKVTDEGLTHLAGLLDLETLALPESITAAGLKRLAALHKLRSLKFTGDKIRFAEVIDFLVNDQGRTAREALRLLLGNALSEEHGKVVGFSLTRHALPIDDAALDYLADFPDLNYLALEAPITERGLARLNRIEHMEGLQLRGMRISARGLRQLAGCRALRGIGLQDCLLSDDALTGLVALRQLERLTVMPGPDAGFELSDANLLAVTRLTGLKSIYLQHEMDVGDDIFGRFAAMSDLESLVIRAAPTAAGLRRLKDLKHLRRIAIDWKNVRFADAMQLLTREFGRTPRDALRIVTDRNRNDAGGIRKLDFDRGPQPSDDDLVCLEGLIELVDLKLPKNVSNAGLAHLTGLRSLKSLSIDSAQVTDEALDVLLGLHNLEELYLTRCPITDDGLQQLAALPKLKRVSLRRTAVTRGGVHRLQGRMPRLSIATE